MKKNKKRLSFILPFFFIVLFLFISFLWWNDNPPLEKRSNPPIINLNINNNLSNNPMFLKIASYNIHFGIGFDIKTKKTKKPNYLSRLKQLAEILKDIDADIVLLQEVDFDSKRSSNIDEGKYLASLAGYNYISKAPTLRKKIHLSFNMLIGKIEHGLCILSKYPIEYSENIIFDHTNEIPFFAAWLFDPHGAQKCSINFNGTIINIINLHLDPWSQQSRENQIEFLKEQWLTGTIMPTILGGDFNSLSPFAKKEGYYLQDAPWFIDRTKWNIKNELTIPKILHAGFKEADPTILSFKKGKNFTFPSNAPKEKIDFIFARHKSKIVKGFVYEEAKDASDHLPVVAEIKINSN
jgi:endonuclease/exonuclease/phosphatase family metal-dependent hydrolase